MIIDGFGGKRIDNLPEENRLMKRNKQKKHIHKMKVMAEIKGKWL